MRITSLGAGAASDKKNEIFVDILERINVLFSPNGYVLNSSVDGCIQMKSYLAGNPELRLALNEDLVIGSYAGGAMGGQEYGSVVLDDCNFNDCVNLSEVSERGGAERGGAERGGGGGGCGRRAYEPLLN